MARPELGTKRVCQNCGAKFYDLSRDPIVCPRCGTVFQAVALVTAARSRPEAARAAVVEEDADLAPVGDVDLVSLEEADAEAGGAAEDEEDVAVEEDIAEAEPFLEEEEGEGDDVTDLIGGDLEEDEES